MSSTDVRWSMTTAHDPFSEIAMDHETMVNGFWPAVDGNGADTAKDIAAEYLNEGDNWVELFGEDDGADLHVTIHSPAASAGKYFVEVERVVKATSARRLDV